MENTFKQAFLIANFQKYERSVKNPACNDNDGTNKSRAMELEI